MLTWSKGDRLVKFFTDESIENLVFRKGIIWSKNSCSRRILTALLSWTATWIGLNKDDTGSFHNEHFNALCRTENVAPSEWLRELLHQCS